MLQVAVADHQSDDGSRWCCPVDAPERIVGGGTTLRRVAGAAEKPPHQVGVVIVVDDRGYQANAAIGAGTDTALSAIQHDYDTLSMSKSHGVLLSTVDSIARRAG